MGFAKLYFHMASATLYLGLKIAEKTLLEM
jgi:hypothetical protein